MTEMKMKAFGLEVPRSRIIVSIFKTSCHLKVLVVTQKIHASRSVVTYAKLVI